MLTSNRMNKIAVMLLSVILLTACKQTIPPSATTEYPDRQLPVTDATETSELEFLSTEDETETMNIISESATDTGETEREETNKSSSESPSEPNMVQRVVVYAEDYVNAPVEPSVIPVYSGQTCIDLTVEADLAGLWDEISPGMIRLSPYDELGRCGSAVVYAVKDILPEGERESTGDAKPSGWVQNKYPGIVDSDPPYIYNRAHLLMWALTGLTSTPENLITGTRFFNTEAMLPTELEVVRYVENGGELLYRVTPIFRENNLLADGVLMEAVSKDGTFSICRFAYNVQPGIILDYATGENRAEEAEAVPEETQQKSGNYILNTSSHKFHDPGCDSVNDIKEKNKQEYTGTRDELLRMGYDPCKRCNP